MNESGERRLLIEGPEECVEQAESLLRSAINQQSPIVAEAIYVPKYAVKKLLEFCKNKCSHILHGFIKTKQLVKAIYVQYRCVLPLIDSFKVEDLKNESAENIFIQEAKIVSFDLPINLDKKCGFVELLMKVLSLLKVENIRMMFMARARLNERSCNGEKIRSISHLSKVHITINRFEMLQLERNFIEVELRGSFFAIMLAKKLILDDIHTNEDCSSKSKASISRKKTRVLTESVAKLPQSQQQQQQLMCFVSAVEHPGHFWIQKLDDRARELDSLITSMTEYYNDLEPVNGATYEVGDMVSSRISHDDNWYRARVVNIIDDHFLDLHFVDFGDNEIVDDNNVFALRSNHLVLPFQSIECSLYNVLPKGKQWSDEAIVKFEELVHVAKWKPIAFEIVYGGSNFYPYEQFQHRQQRPHDVLNVLLFDTLGDKDDCDRASHVTWVKMFKVSYLLPKIVRSE
ncbi:hypothetical protein HELRODRAFT_174354 [Helobdella robusta]|uniref:Tudor domain-containing protein n=1 Tax=Helobdella robusta TaxID=6412 RepID=T1F816_HELRO|nr:hypothetical protein HELRODRAFT_174354 [Helobdella robusta]ESO02902.1 hypothetical protein HELRODRAFT_174354 [Helobdella robusta]